MNNERVYKMIFADVYPLLVAKVERKGRTKDEADEVIRWVTGYTQDELEKAITDRVDYRTFFENAKNINPSRLLVTGTICGVKIQEIEEPLMKEVRILDKVIDELAKGKSLDKIKRK